MTVENLQSIVSDRHPNCALLGYSWHGVSTLPGEPCGSGVWVEAAYYYCAHTCQSSQGFEPPPNFKKT